MSITLKYFLVQATVKKYIYIEWLLGASLSFAMVIEMIIFHHGFIK